LYARPIRILKNRIRNDARMRKREKTKIVEQNLSTFLFDVFQTL